MNGVEGKLKNARFDKAQRDAAPKILSNLSATAE
jgi:hypothetical protein